MNSKSEIRQLLKKIEPFGSKNVRAYIRAKTATPAHPPALLPHHAHRRHRHEQRHHRPQRLSVDAVRVLRREEHRREQRAADERGGGDVDVALPHRRERKHTQPRHITTAHNVTHIIRAHPPPLLCALSQKGNRGNTHPAHTSTQHDAQHVLRSSQTPFSLSTWWRVEMDSRAYALETVR